MLLLLGMLGLLSLLGLLLVGVGLHAAGGVHAVHHALQDTAQQAYSGNRDSWA